MARIDTDLPPPLRESPGGVPLELLRCPLTRQTLQQDGGHLITEDGRFSYPLTDSGIAQFARQPDSPESRRQQVHYDKVARQYIENLGYPHTIEYNAYLDRVFLAQIHKPDLALTAELCCGQGELLGLAGAAVGVGVGVDISASMLEAARRRHSAFHRFTFVQGDATRLPLPDATFNSVFMLGGVHHVPDRARLFAEVSRILKPGGRFYFREPVSDFFLWRWLRALIYRLSPALDAQTERPLLWNETVPLLEEADLHLLSWKTCGFLGFCVFMNSDVLVFNRLFRFLPGIRLLTRAAAWLDHTLLKLPGMERAGLQVVGVAHKSD
jgi:SAM-dependent methyltransferase